MVFEVAMVELMAAAEGEEAQEAMVVDGLAGWEAETKGGEAALAAAGS